MGAARPNRSNPLALNRKLRHQQVSEPPPETNAMTLSALSARNQIAGTIHSVKPGATTTHVTIEVSPTVTITASITNEAAEELKLKAGMPAYAVIKASDVMVGI
jgi:molybdopterin-binding protein